MGDDALLRRNQPVALARLLGQGVPARAHMLAVGRVGVGLEPPGGDVGHGLQIVARDLQKGGIAVAEAPVGQHQVHAHRQVLQDAALLRLVQGFGLLDLAAQQPPQTDGQQHRQRRATPGDGPGQQAFGLGQQGLGGHKTQAPVAVVDLQQAHLRLCVLARGGQGEVVRCTQPLAGMERRRGLTHILQLHGNTAQKPLLLHAGQHAMHIHHRRDDAQEGCLQFPGRAGRRKHRQTQHEGRCIRACLRPIHRRRYRRASTGAAGLQGREQGRLRAQVHAPNDPGLFPGPQVFQQKVGALLTTLPSLTPCIGSQCHLWCGQAGQAVAPVGGLGTYALHVGGQLRRLHVAHEGQVAYFRVMVAHIVGIGHLLELRKIQIGVDDEQIAQARHHLGLRDDALVQGIGGRAHLFHKTHLCQGRIGHALLLHQDIGQDQSQQQGDSPQYHGAGWVPPGDMRLVRRHELSLHPHQPTPRQRLPLSGIAHKRVGAPLVAKAALGAMAGDEHRLIAHGPQALGDAVNELLVVALRKIRASDAARKQHIAHKAALDLRRVEHHVARCVARGMAYVQHLLAHLHGVAILQPARGHESACRRKTKADTLLGQAIDPELVALVRAHDRQLQARAQLGGATGMVDMRMRQPDRHQVQATLLHLGQDGVQIAAGIDDRRLVRLVAPQQGAVLLKSRHGDGVVMQHGKSLSFTVSRQTGTGAEVTNKSPHARQMAMAYTIFVTNRIIAPIS